MEEADESEQIAPATKPFMNPATHSKKHSGKKKKKKEGEQKYRQQEGVGRMEESHESVKTTPGIIHEPEKTAPGKEAFMKIPARLKKLFWAEEEEEEQEYRQTAREYAKKLTTSFKEEVLRASIVADLYRMVDHMEFLILDIEYSRVRMTLSVEELQKVKDDVEFLTAKLRWVMECKESLRGSDILNIVWMPLEWAYTEMERVQKELGTIIDHLAFSAIEKKKEMLEEVEELLNELLRYTECLIEELQVSLRHVEHKTTRAMVEEWKTAEPLSRIAARLEFSPAELHMLKTEEFYCKQHSPKMERQPVSTDEKERMVAPEKFSERSSDEDLKKKRSPDEAVEKEEKDPHDIPEKRKSLYQQPEERKLSSEAPEQAEKSFVEAVEKQLQFWKGSIRFLYEQLEIATNGFRIICHKGSKMLSYEGSLSGKKVFIRRYTYHNKEVLFLADVRAISTLHHRNIVKGIGWCCHGGDLFIVEELADKGHLRDYIGSEMPSLPWDVRFNIVHNLASAILYMHEGCYRCVLHRDIDSANVLLDSDYCAKLTSFRKLKFVYKDTESSDWGKREDVYSFGIVVLEIATEQRSDEPQWWAEDLSFIDMDGNLEVANKMLKGEFDLSQIKKLIFVGLWCTRKLGKPSPSMREVVHFLEFGTTLPDVDETDALFVSRTSSPRGQMSPALHGEAHLSDITTDGHQVEQVLPDEAGSATEHIEIGIPEDYNFSGPVNTSQAQIMKAFISTLQAKIDEGQGWEKILQIIKTFTDSLVMLRVPIKDWNSLAQHVLSELKMIEHLKETKEGDKLKTDLQRKLAQHLATIVQDRAEMGASKENLASIEQEQTTSTSISNLQKQIVETLKNDGANDEINALKKTIIPRIEMIEHIEFAISTLHESLLFRVSNFDFDGN